MTSENLPRLSIITPSFNHGRFLEQTIESVVGQDYPNVEYLVIDGGSTDSSVDVIRKHERSIAYWVSERDEGHRYALQKGFDRATGEIVAWQNADDYYEPGVFGEVMRIFRENPDVDLVYGNIRIVDEDSNELEVLKFVPLWPSRIGLYDGLQFQNHAAFFRRRLWDKIGGIRFEDYNFDVDLILRATLLAKARFIHRILGNYRKHRGSQFFSGDYLDVTVDTRVARNRHLGDWARLPAWAESGLRAAAVARRFGLYAVQGDWDYLGARFARVAARITGRKPQVRAG